MFEVWLIVMMCNVISIVLHQAAQQFENRLECENSNLSPDKKERYKKKIYTAKFLERLLIGVAFALLLAKMVLYMFMAFR